MEKNFNGIKFAVLGGDKRQAVIANELINAGADARTFALGDNKSAIRGAEHCLSVEKAIEGCDVVVLPLPVTRDNTHLAAQNVKVPLLEIVKLTAKSKALILGGMIPVETLRQCEALGIEAHDYYKNESLQRKNARPSAEGALMIAMEHTDITVKGMKALVTGYGRIGSILTDMLDKLGADVTVGARRDETLCELSLMGYKAIRLCGDSIELIEAVNNCDVIFNTVPSVILTEKVLNKVKNKPLYIEIASSPGGIDLTAARDVGLETIFAPSLPGKYSPISAGKYVFETICEILIERRKI